MVWVRQSLRSGHSRNSISAMVLGILCSLPMTANVVGQGPSSPSTVSPSGLSRQLARWVADLQSSDLETRRDAAYQLADLHEDAASAIEALRVGLKDPDIQVWAECNRALGYLGPKSIVAIDDVIERLGSDDEQRRFRSAHTIGRMGEAALPKLSELLGSKKSQLREGAARALGWMPSSTVTPAIINELIVLLEDPQEHVRNVACETLGKLGPAALDRLIPLLHTDRPQVQAGAAIAIAAQGVSAVAATNPLIVNAIDHADMKVRIASLAALGDIAPGDLAIARAIMHGLGEELDDVRQAAIEVAVKATPQVQLALIDPMMELLKTRPEWVEHLAFVWGEMEEIATPAVPSLLDFLVDHPETSTGVIARTLGKIGSAALPPALAALREGKIDLSTLKLVLNEMPPSVQNDLVQGVTDPHPAMRQLAVASLSRLVPLPLDVAERLIAMASDPVPEVRAEAIMSLSKLPPTVTHEQLESVLAGGVRDPESQVRGAAIVACGNRLSDTQRVISLLEAGVDDTDVHVRRIAAQQLTKYPKLPESLYDPLSKMITSSDSLECRRAALSALVAVEGERAKIASLLAQSLSDSETSIREQALASLARLGDAAKEQLPVVAEQLQAPEPRIRVAALESMGKFAEQAESYFDQVHVLCGDSEVEVRVAATVTTTLLTKNSERTLPVLMKALDDSAWEVRQLAAIELGKLGSHAAPAVPALIQMLRKEEESEIAGQALRAIDTPSETAIPMLIEILKDNSIGRRTQFYTLFMLRKLGPKASSALPFLREKREKAEGRARESLDRAIGEIEGSAS